MARVLASRSPGIAETEIGVPGVVAGGVCSPRASLNEYQTPTRPFPVQIRPEPSSMSSMSSPQSRMPALFSRPALALAPARPPRAEEPAADPAAPPDAPE